MGGWRTTLALDDDGGATLGTIRRRRRLATSCGFAAERRTSECPSRSYWMQRRASSSLPGLLLCRLVAFPLWRLRRQFYRLGDRSLRSLFFSPSFPPPFPHQQHSYLA